MVSIKLEDDSKEYGNARCSKRFKYLIGSIKLKYVAMGKRTPTETEITYKIAKYVEQQGDWINEIIKQ